MTRYLVAAVLVVQVSALSILPDPALAGSPYYTDQDREPSRPDPNPHGIPNVPNLQGCIPLCEQDLDPCDPPVFKQADGRCNFIR
jgi:hypothetical protein